MELHSKQLPPNNSNNNNNNDNNNNNNNNNNNEDVEITAHKKRYISPEERQKIIDELRLVPKKDAYFKKIIDELMLTLKNIHISKRKTTNY